MNERGMRQSHAAAEMTLFFCAFFLPGYIAQTAMASAGPVTSSLLLQSIVTGIPQFLLMAYVAGVTGPASAPRWGFVRLESRDGLRIVSLVLACFAVAAPFIGLAIALPSRWTSALAMGYRWGLRSASQLPLALLFGLTAGYREEFFFRSYLLGRLDEIGIPVPYAAAGSTALFCLGHLYEGPLGIAIVAALGALFCVVYIRRRNLHVVAISHGAYNALVLCLSLVFPRPLPASACMHVFFTASAYGFTYPASLLYH
jgi:membrane protease YdiL (CAAX protease family)